jgi:cytochrome c oxidase subunit 6a
LVFRVPYISLIFIVLVGTAWVYNAEKEHHDHLEHLRHDNDGQLPEGPAYPYLNVRAKPYPWGPNSLFFNKDVRIYGLYSSHG